MPDSNHFTKLRVPTTDESPSLPTTFSNIREDLGAGRIILPAADASERDSLYGGTEVPDGSIVSATGSPDIWKKVAGSFITLHEDTGWVSLSGAVFDPNWTDDGSKYRILNGVVYLFWSAIGSGGGSEVIPDTGNITDHTIMTVPSEITPQNDGVDGICWENNRLRKGSFAVFNTSTLLITHIFAPGQTFFENSTFRGYISYPKDI